VARRWTVAAVFAALIIQGLVVPAFAAQGAAAAPVQAHSTIRARIVHWKPVPYRHTRRAPVARRTGGRSDKQLALRMGHYARLHDHRDHGPTGAWLPKHGRALPGRPAARAVTGSGSNGRVLILDSTVTGGTSSVEAQQAAADGFGVDVVDSSTWSSMTAAQFSAYRAIILGDPTCGDESAVAAAEANASVWGPVINGNIEIVGTDPVFHGFNVVPQRGVDFATGRANTTGAYIDLSCYFEGTSPQTHVSLLDGLDPTGTGFSVQGVGCADSVHITTYSPALTGIDDATLNGWECSVHEAFDTWPAKFGVLAMDLDAGSLYTAPDGTTGVPYILAYPPGAFSGATLTSGGGNASSHNNQCEATQAPVDCATGEFWHTFNDLTVPGNGPALDLSRTYSSALAGVNSPFGFGWNSGYSMSLAVDSASGYVQVTQENGATTVFTPDGSGGYAAPPEVYATLTKNADGTWTFIRQQQQRFVFSATGQLISISDLNGYTTTLSYNGSGQLTTVSDPEGRTLSFSYGSNGDIASATDPAGRTVSYGYDSSGNLTSVTNPAGGTWTFSYDANHLMTSMTDPRGGTVSNVYDATGRVTSQTDAAGRTTTFSYSTDGTSPTIIDPNGNETDETYSGGQLVSLTKGAGTASAATWQYTYDPATNAMTSQTDPNGNVTTYGYTSGSFKPTSVTDPLGRTTTTTYNTFEEPLTVTDPSGVTTTSTYDATGNLTSVSRPLTGTSSTRSTTYTYGDASHPGEVTATTDPNGNTTHYGYDAYGDLTASTDPLGNQTTYSYDIIGHRTSMVSPRGNASGANPAQFTTSYSYDTLGNLVKQTDPLGHTTSYTYDANSNKTSLTDASGRTTSYSYDADNELTKLTRPDSTVMTYTYDGNGNQTSQTNAAGQVTSYTYDPLDRLSSTTSPLGQTTSYSYDGVGNRLSLTAPSGQVTSYGYDLANELTSINYSDGVTPSVSFSYTANGQRASMADGTGTTSYTYDSLGRLTKVTNGAGQAVSYSYDLDGNLTALGYPNGKTVSRTFNAASQLTGVKDWLGNTTSFGYDPNGDLTAEAYPNGVNTASAYDNAGQLTSITDTSGAATLASFSYTRDNTGLVTSANTGVIPGGNENYTYTPLSQLGSRNGAPFTYDPAGNMTGLPAGTTQTFNAGSELTGTSQPASTSAPALDQQVSADQASHSSKLTSPAISTRTSGELLLAFISATGPSPGSQTITAVSGAGLVWKEVARANHKPGTAEVWQAYAATPVTGATVVATLGSTAHDGSITVAAFTGAAAATGAHAVASGASKSPAVVLTTTQPDSVIWAVGEDATHAGTVTPSSGQTVVHQFADTSSHATYWAQDTKPVSAAGTAVTVADTLAATDSWNLAAVEIRSATGTTMTTGYTYNNNGDLTKVAPSNGPATKLTYDQANRLTGYGPATFAYNGDGLLVSKTGTGAAATRFTWDTSGPLPLLLANGSIYFIYGPHGQPVEHIQGSTVTYLHTDQQGSVRLITSSTGATAGTYTYTAYGAISSHTGTATSAVQYDGQFADSTSGLIYLRARYYNPATGQFLTVDPAAQVTEAPYAYAVDDPLNASDNSGLYVWGSCAGISASFWVGYSAQVCTLHQSNSALAMSLGIAADATNHGGLEDLFVATKTVVLRDAVVGTPSAGLNAGEFVSTAPNISDVEKSHCSSIGGSADIGISGGLDLTLNCTGPDGKTFSSGEVSVGVGAPDAEIHGSPGSSPPPSIPCGPPPIPLLIL
jgi:RHS repeat-associated protein